MATTGADRTIVFDFLLLPPGPAGRAAATKNRAFPAGHVGSRQSSLRGGKPRSGVHGFNRAWPLLAIRRDRYATRIRVAARTRPCRRSYATLLGLTRTPGPAPGVAAARQPRAVLRNRFAVGTRPWTGPARHRLHRPVFGGRYKSKYLVRHRKTISYRFPSVGNALCGVPRRAGAAHFRGSRNATEGVPYRHTFIFDSVVYCFTAALPPPPRRVCTEFCAQRNNCAVEGTVPFLLTQKSGQSPPSGTVQQVGCVKRTKNRVLRHGAFHAPYGTVRRKRNGFIGGSTVQSQEKVFAGRVLWRPGRPAL